MSVHLPVCISVRHILYILTLFVSDILHCRSNSYTHKCISHSQIYIFIVLLTKINTALQFAYNIVILFFYISRILFSHVLFIRTNYISFISVKDQFTLFFLANLNCSLLKYEERPSYFVLSVSFN